jgi:hypothetical protein
MINEIDLNTKLDIGYILVFRPNPVNPVNPVD